MKKEEIQKIKNIIANLESVTENLNDLNSQLGNSPQLYDFRLFSESMTKIKDAKTIAYKLVEEK